MEISSQRCQEQWVHDTIKVYLLVMEHATQGTPYMCCDLISVRIRGWPRDKRAGLARQGTANMEKTTPHVLCFFQPDYSYTSRLFGNTFGTPGFKSNDFERPLHLTPHTLFPPVLYSSLY